MSEKTLYYNDAVSFLESIPRFTDNRFAATSAFYGFLIEQGVIPDRRPKVFHVAGTNGKGSVCAYLKSMHLAMGRSVGVFTSPHLIDMRERITIGDELISAKDFYECFMTVMSYLDEFKKHDPFKDYSPAYFDYLFFIAAVYFGHNDLDAIIWETGMGGRLDATNVIKDKSVTIITEIGMDHMEILGDTVEAIASEKAGIIRKGVPVIAVRNDPESMRVIEAEAKAKGAPLVVAPDASDIEKKMNDKGIDFSYKSHYYNNATLAVVGHAVYQTENATAAAMAMEAVYSREELSLETIRTGLLSMRHPGRMEMTAPGVYLDGAHNADGIRALIRSAAVDRCDGRRYMIFSAAKDKQAEEELMMIADSGLFSKVCIVPILGSRGRSAEDLAALVDILKDRQTDCELSGDFREAYEGDVKKTTGSDRLYVCGSLYLIGGLKEYLDSMRSGQ